MGGQADLALLPKHIIKAEGPKLTRACTIHRQHYQDSPIPNSNWRVVGNSFEKLTNLKVINPTRDIG
jgi:hypothetical protein